MKLLHSNCPQCGSLDTRTILSQGEPYLKCVASDSCSYFERRFDLLVLDEGESGPRAPRPRTWFYTRTSHQVCFIFPTVAVGFDAKGLPFMEIGWGIWSIGIGTLTE